MSVQILNDLSIDAAFEVLLGCCHCQRWAADMVSARPYSSEQQCLEQAELSWQSASEAELMEAFSGHPEIGDMQALRNKYAASANREQGQINDASEQVLAQLGAANKLYAQKNGFIFIVCATGKSAAEMLGLLQQRINNDRAVELSIAAAEQLKITKLRLQNLFQ